MNPEDIESRDFFVGLRGYDRDEVHQFLAEVAASHRAALAELEELRNRPLPPPDPFTDVGSSVTAILRTANESAEQISVEAHADADRIRAEADAYAAPLRQEADTYATAIRQEADTYAEHVRREADGEATRLRDEATRIVDAARAECERVVRAFQDDADRVAADAERRGRDRAAATAEEAIAKLTEANRRHEELRARLAEASDEIQLALMAMGDERTDPVVVIREAALHDDAPDEVLDVTDGTDVDSHQVWPTAG